jgi:cytochrome c oxidase cbb3-type subunit III
MRLLAIGGIILALAGCKREDREIRTPLPKVSEQDAIVMSTNAPGGGTPVAAANPTSGEFAENAYHISEGKRLYEWFNCSGCHFQGGGGIGPALMDDQWIYGSSMENIAATVREGRPNGMPSFRSTIPPPQIWEIAAYVRSLGGLAPQAAVPARSDGMNGVPSSQQPQPDKGGLPGAALPHQ